MRYVEIEAVTALNKLKKRGLPYKYDLNIYRGCSHGCKYCYAQKSHQYLSSNNFAEEIFVKINIIDVLEKTLCSKSWQGEIINIGGVCDSYQHCEKDYKLMRQILKLMIKYKNPIIISTKSDLILRDLDLIDELAHYTYVNIPICITTTDSKIASKVEPGASPPDMRFRTLSELSRTKASTGLHAMPILPFLADDQKILEQLVSWAACAKASYMLSGILYLTGNIKQHYMRFIQNEYPEFYQDYKSLYLKGSAKKDYKTRIYGYLAEMRKKYQVNNSYQKNLPRNSVNSKKAEDRFIRLFD